MQTTFGQLSVSYPDGRVEEHPLTRAVVRVGRGTADNEIDLGDNPQISRQHAQFLCRPGRVAVMSLSPNGIVVNGLRPGLGEEVDLDDGAVVEIGPARIVVALGGPAPARTVAATQGSAATATPPATAMMPPAVDPALATPPPAVEPPPVADPPLASLPPPAVPPPAVEPPAIAPARTPAAEHLDLRLDTEQVAVVPGSAVSLGARVEKRFGEVDLVGLHIEGLDPEWYTVTPASVGLFPRDANRAEGGGEPPPSRGLFTVVISPPRHPTSTRGSYSCTVVATSQYGLGPPVHRPLTVDVQPFYQLEARLSPRRPTGRMSGRLKLALTNLSNLPLPVSLAAEDEEERLRFGLACDRVELAANSSETIVINARPLRLWPFGRPMRYELSATARPATAEVPPLVVRDTLTLTRLPGWLQLIPLLLLLGLAIGYVLLLLPDQRATGTLTIQDLARREEVVAQVVPRDPVALSFQRDGVVETIMVKPEDHVVAGELLAELRYYEQLVALRKAEDGLERAIADLEAARRQQQRDVRIAELGLAQAQNDVARLGPGGADDPAREQQSAVATAQRDLAASQRAAARSAAEASEAKTAAEAALVKAAEDLQEAQQRYSKAYWANDWVEQYGTDPNAVAERTETTGTMTNTVQTRPVKLNPVQRQAFKDALATAEREMQAAERNVDAARRALDLARADEISQNAAAGDAVQAAEEQIAALTTAAGGPSPQLEQARIAAEVAQIRVEGVRESGLEPFIKAVEAAQDAVNDARAQLENRTIRAPTAGVILAVSVPVSTSVQAAAPVISMAVEGHLDLAAQLTPEQLAGLSERPTVSVTLDSTDAADGIANLSRQPAVVAVPGQDQAARFAPDATLASALKLGSQARLTVTLAERPQALAVYPPFVHVDGERRYLLAREPGCPWSPYGRGLLLRLCERRIYVEPGLVDPPYVEVQTSYDQLYTLDRLRAFAAPLPDADALPAAQTTAQAAESTPEGDALTLVAP